MAETLISPLGNILKDSKILVSVDHASEDILVVSFPFRTKLYQGILIDSTNRYLPCGYPSQEVVRWSPPRPEAPPDTTPSPAQDTNRPFYSLSNRFTYFQDVLFQKNIALAKSAKQARAKAQKMTVRLRPRQVLCSKCRSICNENSENVHSTSNNKKSDSNSNNIKNLLTENSSNENQNVEMKSPRKVRTTLVPKLSRLEPEDIRGLNGGRSEGRVWSEMLEADKQMVLRKKRSVGSMEDLWDETVFEEAAKKAKTTPIIKISFGSPGEGTVLKIPSKVQLSGSEGEEESKDTPDSKALKKAMKKAKKEAKRKISPERDQEPPSPSEPNYKKHRHRVKHKKRHKSSKEEDIKDKCLKQKLSINLKRVSGGPGEEESWSGESSRSSEAVKDLEETKMSEYTLQESFHQFVPNPPPQIDQHDCKENLHKAGPSPHLPSPSPKLSRGSSAKRKKLETLESLLKVREAASMQEKLSERLGNAILIDKPSVTGNSSKFNKLPVETDFNTSAGDCTLSSVGVVQRVIVLPAANVRDCIESLEVQQSPTQLPHNDKIIPSCSDSGKLSSSLSFSSTKDISKEVESVEPVLEQINDLKSHSDNFISVKGSLEEIKENKENLLQSITSEKVKPTLKLDDTLEDILQGSEDSLLELEDTAEDALLESDKEISEESEQLLTSCVILPSPRNSAQPVYSQLEISEKKVKDIKDKANEIKHKSDKVLIDMLKRPLLSDELLSKNVHVMSSEPHISVDIVLKAEEIAADDVLQIADLEPVELPQSSDDFQSVSTKMECSDRYTTSEEPLDSSEDSEFLPAEDGLDCLPSEDVLFCVPLKIVPVPPKDDTLDSNPPSLDCATSNQNIDQTTKESLDCAPPSLDPAPSEIILHCSSPQGSLDNAPPIHSLDCAPPNLDCQDCAPHLDNLEHAPPDNSIGCAPPDLDCAPPNLDCAPALESVERTPPKLSLDRTLSSVSLDCILSENSEECAPPLERLDCAPTRDSIDCAPPNLDFGPSENSRDEAHPSESLDFAPPLESLDRAPLDDPTECSSPESNLDSIPDFPASSPLGTRQDVSRCQTKDGSVFSVGDIVWAKLHGFPWWPAKVVRLCTSGNSMGGCDARVAWFGSATSSLMSANQMSPFIQTFKAKYNRDRKSSGYREAIRQATTEASSRDFHPPLPIAEINKLLAL